MTFRFEFQKYTRWPFIERVKLESHLDIHHFSYFSSCYVSITKRNQISPMEEFIS